MDARPKGRTPRDVEVWLETIGRAVAEGRLRNQDADAATRAVCEWLKAHEAGRVAERVEELREQVVALKKRRPMKAVS